jgi:hypothetical protein
MISDEVQHVVVTGHGRSGTNLVLDLLDASANTICRNEANEIPDACLNRLEPGYFPPETQDAEVFWALLNDSIYYRSNRDRFRYWHKNFYRQTLLQSTYLNMLQHSHLRKALHPLTAGKEWKLPDGIYNRQAVAAAVAVHKILLWPGRLLSAHEALDKLKLIHVIREPEGFLQSWYGRYVLHHPNGGEQVFADNRSSVVRIMSCFGRDAETLYAGGYTLKALLESEMWRWRYANEVMFDALSGSQRYLLVTYADAVHRKSEVAEKLANFCGVQFDEGMRKRIGQNENTLFANRKQHLLDPTLVDEVSHRVLESSTLSAVFAPVPQKKAKDHM